MILIDIYQILFLSGFQVETLILKNSLQYIIAQQLKILMIRKYTQVLTIVDALSNLFVILKEGCHL
jgi:hypothetical protein